MHTHAYDHQQVMREKLLYAIHHCSAIDNDFRVHSNELLNTEAGEAPADLDYVDDAEEDLEETIDDGAAQASDVPLPAEPTGGLRACT
jgi:hypothetical protein